MGKLLFSLLLLPSLAWGAVVERVAAVVNNEVIALSQIYEIGSEFIGEATQADSSPASRRSAELKVLEELIAQELMVQEMSRLAIDVTSTEVDQALDDIASRNGVDRSQLKAEVERTGLAWAAYRESITQELRGMKFNQVVLQPRVSLSEDEITNLYKSKATTMEGGRVLDGIFLAWSPFGFFCDNSVVPCSAQSGYRTDISQFFYFFFKTGIDHICCSCNICFHNNISILLVKGNNRSSVINFIYVFKGIQQRAKIKNVPFNPFNP